MFPEIKRPWTTNNAKIRHRKSAERGKGSEMSPYEAALVAVFFSLSFFFALITTRCYFLSPLAVNDDQGHCVLFLITRPNAWLPQSIPFEDKWRDTEMEASWFVRTTINKISSVNFWRIIRWIPSKRYVVLLSYLFHFAFSTISWCIK